MDVVNSLLRNKVQKDLIVKATFLFVSIGIEKVHIEWSKLLIRNLTEALDVKSGISKLIFANKFFIVCEQF